MLDDLQQNSDEARRETEKLAAERAKATEIKQQAEAASLVAEVAQAAMQKRADELAAMENRLTGWDHALRIWETELNELKDILGARVAEFESQKVRDTDAKVEREAALTERENNLVEREQRIESDREAMKAVLRAIGS